MDKNISSTVQDYYDLLFDNAAFHVANVQEGLEELKDENIEIQGQLNRNEPDIDRDALSKTLTENTKLIGTAIHCLQNGVVMRDGISFATEILYDSEIELSDRFKEAPVSEKYDYLLEKFSRDYIDGVKKAFSDAEMNFSEANTRSESHKSERPTTWENLRSFGVADWKWSESQVALDSQAVTDMKQMTEISEYAEHGTVVLLDAKWSAAKKIDEFFPDVSRQRQEEMAKEYSSRLENAPFSYMPTWLNGIPLNMWASLARSIPKWKIPSKVGKKNSMSIM